jgi:uncharacterized protein YeaO (DUF488 family)
MTPETTDLQPESWLYTREDESVRVAVHEDAGVWAASITGPGAENRLRVFHDQTTFDAFRTEHIRELVSKGFRMRAMSERRARDHKKRPRAKVIRHERRR